MTSMMTSLMGIQADAEENQHERDAVYSSTVLYDMMNSMVSAEMQTNNLKSFKNFIENDKSGISSHISSIQYSYDLDMNIYAEDCDGVIVKTDVTELFQRAMSATFGGDYSSYFSTFGQAYNMMNAWQEMLPGENGELINPLIKQQYDTIYGKWPTRYDEAVLVVDKNNNVSDLTLYALGLKSSASLSEDMESFINQENLHTELEKWSYEEICDLKLRYIYPADEYRYDEEENVYTNVADEDIGLRTLFTNGLPIRIVGIVRQKSDALSGMIASGAVGYTHSLVEYVVGEAAKKDLVARQLAHPDTDVFNGLPFLDENDEVQTKSRKIESAKKYIRNADDEKLADLYVEFMTVPEDSYIDEQLDEQLKDVSRKDVEDMVLQYYPSYASFLKEMDDDTLFDYMRQMISQQVKEQYAIQMRAMYAYLPDEELARDFRLLSLEDDDYVWLYDNAMPPAYSDSTVRKNLKALGYVDLESPSTINIYAATFEDKDAIANAIQDYNDKVPEDDQIEYTDLVAMLMKSVSNIINVISYVLIAFVAISLVVSSIMIGIITYISVLERTKEIGILRAIGASKRDVSRVFNAETFIIGLFAGLLGIGFTILLNIPINIIIHDVTNNYSINSSLPLIGAVGLVLVSVTLTFVAGLIPSGLAAKKDPVEALRNE